MVETYRNKQQEPYHPDIFKKQLEHSSFGKLFLALLDNEFKHEPIEAADIAAFLGNVNSVKTIIRSKKWDVQGLFSKEQAKEIALEQSVKIQATDKFDNLWTEREIMRGYFAPRGLNKELMDNLSSFVSHNWKTHPYVDTPTFLAIRQIGLIIKASRISDVEKKHKKIIYIGKSNHNKEEETLNTNGKSEPREPLILDENCKHHWKIASPNGVYSEGTCIYCSSRADFRNGPKWTDSSEEAKEIRKIPKVRGSLKFDEEVDPVEI